MAADDWYEDESMKEDDDVAIREYDITASPNDFNVKTIYDFIESGVTKIPGFQRHYVWDIKRASKLIESIIIGIPIPQIFLFEERRNSFLVIDGQQRLMSIYYFIKHRFPKKEKRTELRQIFDEKGTIPDRILQDSAYFADFKLNLPASIPGNVNRLHGLNYSTLDDYRTTFDLRTIRNVIVKQTHPADDDSSIYEIFNRLNSGGMNLSPQEIRGSLYHSPFYTMLSRVNIDHRWRKLIGLAEADLHMKDIEFLLRGFALLVEGATYKPSMAQFLNSFSKHCQGITEEQVKYLEGLFSSFLDACAKLPDRAFYGRTKKFTISIYDAVFAAVCKFPFSARGVVTAEIDPERLDALKMDDEFTSASQSRTSSKPNVAKRLEKAEEILLQGAD